jgi:hypothetical protein
MDLNPISMTLLIHLGASANLRVLKEEVRKLESRNTDIDSDDEVNFGY